MQCQWPLNVFQLSTFCAIHDIGYTATRDNQIYCRSHKLVYLVRGKDQSRNPWHYVLIDKSKETAFKHAIQSGTKEVAKYGKVLYSGWGKNPPEDIVHTVEKEFS